MSGAIRNMWRLAAGPDEAAERPRTHTGHRDGTNPIRDKNLNVRLVQERAAINDMPLERFNSQPFTGPIPKKGK